MIFHRKYRLMAEADAVSSGGAAVADTAVVVTAETTPEAVAEPAAPAEAPAQDSLLKQPPTTTAAKEAPAAPMAEPAWLSKVPEKSRVMNAEGKPDAEATLAKLGESYVNLEKLKGPALPASPSDYTFQPPERFKDMVLDDAASTGFREKCHKAGFTQAQYEFTMGQYFDLVPGVLDAATKLSASEARTELSKVWKSEAEFEAGLSAAQRAVDNAPVAIRNDVWSRFGRDPAFLQFAASLGKEMQEDRPPQNADGGGGASNEVETLMASNAYRDPKDPQHAAVSAKVQAHFKRTRGEGMAY